MRKKTPYCFLGSQLRSKTRERAYWTQYNNNKCIKRTRENNRFANQKKFMNERIGNGLKINNINKESEYLD